MYAKTRMAIIVIMMFNGNMLFILSVNNAYCTIYDSRQSPDIAHIHFLFLSRNLLLFGELHNLYKYIVIPINGINDSICHWDMAELFVQANIKM